MALGMPDGRRNKNKRETYHQLPDDHVVGPDPRHNSMRKKEEESTPVAHAAPAPDPSPENEGFIATRRSKKTKTTS